MNNSMVTLLCLPLLQLDMINSCWMVVSFKRFTLHWSCSTSLNYSLCKDFVAPSSALTCVLPVISGFFKGTDVFLGFWPFGNALCKAVVSIDYYNMFTSTFTLTVMSMDRYVAVCHPVKALDMRTPHKAKVNVSFQSVTLISFTALTRL